jgi:hypothetical protein
MLHKIIAAQATKLMKKHTELFDYAADLAFKAIERWPILAKKLT